MFLQIQLRKPLPKKRSLKAITVISPKIVTISLVNPPLCYRKTARKEITPVYYF